MTNVHANVIAKLVFSFDIVLVMSESRYLRKEKVNQECVDNDFLCESKHGFHTCFAHPVFQCAP